MNDKDKPHVAPTPAPKEPPPPPPAKEQPAGGSKGATGQPAVSLPPEAYMTEQEKDALKPADKKETK